MLYIDFKSLLYSDTLLPDIFISEYLPSLKSEYIKLYVYCVFLSNKNKTATVNDLVHLLNLSKQTIEDGFRFMEELGLLTRTDKGIIIIDIKEKEIQKLYKPYSTSSPEDAAAKSAVHVRRRQVITAINNTFFSGVMSPTWYLDINNWFDIYGFEEDVMLMLFKHCYDNNGLAKPYIAKVAESWHQKKIHNSFEVDRYMQGYAAMKAVSQQIRKKLKLRKPLDEYQEELIDKWVNQFKFSFEMIELALRSSLYAPNAGFSYYDKILSDWHKRGLDTIDKIKAILEKNKASRENSSDSKGIASDNKRTGGNNSGHGRNVAGKIGSKGRDSDSNRNNAGNFNQRDYDDDFFKQFVSNAYDADDTEKNE